MVMNKKIGAGMALVAGLIGMFMSGAAYALPEVDVGSRALVGPAVIEPAQYVAPDAAAMDPESDAVTVNGDAGQTID